MGITTIEFNSILAFEISLVDSLTDVFEVEPRIYVFHYLFHRKLELDMIFFFKTFPILPVLQPLSKQIYFVRVTVSAVTFTKRSHHTHRNDMLVFWERLLGAWRLKFQKEKTASDQMLNRVLISFFFRFKRLLCCLYKFINDPSHSIELIMFLVLDFPCVADPFDEGFMR